MQIHAGRKMKFVHMGPRSRQLCFFSNAGEFFRSLVFEDLRIQDNLLPILLTGTQCTSRSAYLQIRSKTLSVLFRDSWARNT